MASPGPLPQREFMAGLRQAAGVTVGLPATRRMVELAASVLGTDAELILKSRRVAPTKIVRSGFEFEYPEWQPAASELIQRWRDR